MPRCTRPKSSAEIGQSSQPRVRSAAGAVFAVTTSATTVLVVIADIARQTAQPACTYVGFLRKRAAIEFSATLKVANTIVTLIQLSIGGSFRHAAVFAGGVGAALATVISFILRATDRYRQHQRQSHFRLHA